MRSHDEEPKQNASCRCHSRGAWTCPACTETPTRASKAARKNLNAWIKLAMLNWGLERRLSNLDSPEHREREAASPGHRSTVPKSRGRKFVWVPLCYSASLMALAINRLKEIDFKASSQQLHQFISIQMDP